MKILLISALACLALSAQGAIAQEACKAPVLPTRPALVAVALPGEVAKPACMDTGNCSKTLAANYSTAVAAANVAIDEHNKQIVLANGYLMSLDTFVDDMNNFVSCERKSVAVSVAAAPKP